MCLRGHRCEGGVGDAAPSETCCTRVGAVAGGREMDLKL